MHRIGRTARADRTGEAITFINPKQVKNFLDIEELIEKFVKMYVNPVTVNMGASGEKAIRKMFEMAREKDLVPEFEIKISEPLD